MDWGSIINIGTQAIGALSGLKKTKKTSGAIEEAYGKGLAALEALQPPGLEDLYTDLQNYVLQGELSPEEFKAYLQENTELGDIQIPQEIIDQQYQVLRGLKQIADEGGLTKVDMARINDAKEQMLTAARGQSQRTQQEFAERGMSGSGLEAASRLSNDSASIQAASRAGFDIAALGEERALEALKASGEAAGSLRVQEYGQQRDAALAQDAINRFNTSVKQSSSDKTIADRNSAEAANLAARQALSNSNVDINNEEEINRRNAVQGDFNNRKGIADSMISAGQAQGKALETTAGANAKANTNWYDTLGKLGGGIYDAYQKNKTTSDERVKTETAALSDEDVDNILDAITGHKFKYAKGFKYDDGGTPHVGIMAQDVERSPLHSMVEKDEDGVLAVKDGEAAMAALGMLSNMHKRVKKLEGK